MRGTARACRRRWPASSSFADGLEIYRRLVPAPPARARLGVLVEVGAGQSAAVAALMRAAGLVDVESRPDLGKVERVVRGRVEARG